MGGIFNKFSGGKKVDQAPFIRIPFKESMLKYGSDKPDLRNPLIIQDATSFFYNSGFGVYDSKVIAGEKIRAIVAPKAGDKPRSFFDKLDAYAKEENMGGIAYVALSANGPKGIAKYFSAEKMAELKALYGVNEGDAVIFTGGAEKVLNKFAGKIRNKIGEELGLFDYNPLEILAYQYDMVCNGVELASGAVRNHKPEIMYKAFEIAGYDHSVVDNKFGGMINAFKYGAPPHAGGAPGIDRTVMLLLDEPIIRDVIIFPLNGKAQDLMMQAPNTVTEKQLKELHIKLDLDNK